MKAMVLEKPGAPLQMKELPMPRPRSDQVLIKVTACGVCRTDLHIVDDDLQHPKPPIVPGHEIVGHVVEAGQDVRRLKVGDKIGIPWLGSTCGSCRYCQSREENLCDEAWFTGYHMSDIPSFPCEFLWGERILRSVAKLTHHGAEAFLDIAPHISVKTHVQPFPVDRAN